MLVYWRVIYCLKARIWSNETDAVPMNADLFVWQRNAAKALHCKNRIRRGFFAPISKALSCYCLLGWAKKSKFLIWAFLFAGHLQNGVRDPPKKFQIYRPINDRWQAIFVLGSVLMGKRPKNGQKMTIFKNGLKTHPKVVNASNQRWFHHFWGMLDL